MSERGANDLQEYNDIGINSTLDWKRIRKLLRIGLFASFLVFAGDMLLGYGLEDQALYGLERQLSNYIARSDIVLFWSSLLGIVGIPLEGLSYFGIYRLIACKSEKYAHIYRSSIFGYLIFGGCGVHMPCVASVYVYKHMLETASELAYDCAIQFASYFLLPGTVLFAVFLVVLCGSQMMAFAKGFTPYPKWCLIFSLPLPFLVIVIMSLLIGNTALMNGLSTAWISIGNIWIFGGLLLFMPKAGKASMISR